MTLPAIISIVRSFLAVVLFISISPIIYAQSSVVHAREDENKILERLKDRNLVSDHVAPGKAFYRDASGALRMADYKCFITETSDPYDPAGDLWMDMGMSSYKLDEAFTFKSAANVNVKLFSCEAEANYLKEIQDTENSISVSFAQSAYHVIDVEPLGYGMEALKPVGRGIYKDGRNPDFKPLCGEHIFTSILRGGLIAFSIKVNFRSHQEKRQFHGKFQGSFANIIKASHEIKKWSNEVGSGTTMTVLAMQRGGEPEKLSRIVQGKSPDGNYHVISCGASNMDACIRTADDLYRYVLEEFPTQYSLSESQNLYGFPIEFTQSLPVKYMGLPDKSSGQLDEL